MIDHIVMAVKDYAKSKAFYERALLPLGITMVKEFGTYGGLGKNGKPFFWIGGQSPSFWNAAHRAGTAPIHVALIAPDRQSVDAFYAAALAAGATDYGAPGIRAHYHPNYYGAFVIDLDGNNIEAVYHGG